MKGKGVILIAAAFFLAGAAWSSPPRYVYEGKWGSAGTANGLFSYPRGVAVAANGNVYVADATNRRVQYFTAAGSFLGKWGTYGTGDGQFTLPTAVAFSPGGYVFVTDRHRIQYFTSSGSYVGQWGQRGEGNGEFTDPEALGLRSDARIYVVDRRNNRVQYFKQENPAVAPASLGRVKALFK